MRPGDAADLLVLCMALATLVAIAAGWLP